MTRLKKPTSLLELLHTRTAVYVLYTALFTVLCALVFSPFWETGKGFVWYIDGNYQHLNAFIYLGSYLRERVMELFQTGSLTFPMWEFGIGYGGDVITTLSYYVLGDPLCLVSVFTPAAAAETVYSALILLRLYLAGLCFCAFCRKMDCERSSTVIAAFMYIFCGFSLYAAVRHPYFTTPMMVWPLMLIGAEKLLRGEKPTAFILSVFLAAVSNFYFFYMQVILTVCYVVFRFFSFPENRHIKPFFREFGRFFGYALVGVAMAGVLLLPSLLTVLTDARSDTDYTFSFFYSFREYTSIPAGFFSYTSPVYWAYIGISPIALLGVGALFLQRRQDGWLKGLLALFLLFLCLPVCGYVLNGFGYVAGRWVWGLSLLIAFIFAKTFPQLTYLSGKQRYFVCLCSGCYVGFCLVWDHNRYAAVLLGCTMLLIGTLILCGAPRFRRLKLWKFSLPRRRVMQLAALFLTVISLLQMRTARYESVDYATEFRDSGMALEHLQQDHAATWDLIEDKDFFRIDSNLSGNEQYNYLLTEGQSTTFSYWSLQNPYLLEYMRLNSCYSAQQNVLRGMQSRSFLLPFASARYQTVNQAHTYAVPYGYSFFGEAENLKGETIRLYRGNLSLPLSYTCDTVVDKADYVAMTLVERQQAMLYGAVVESADKAALPLADAVTKDLSTKLTYTVQENENVTVTDNAITVYKDGAFVVLDVEIPANQEFYVLWSGLSFKGMSPRERYSDEAWALLTDSQQKAILKSDREYTETDRPRLSAASGKSSTAVTRYATTHIHSHNRTDYLLNLNYSKTVRTSVRLAFSDAGVYSFDELALITQPFDDLAPAVKAMTADTLQNVAISANRIAGNISLNTDKLLVLSVPYSSGWSVMVDGKDATLLRANVAYMGVPLTAGEHTVELTYRTPLLFEGALLSLLGIVAFIAVVVIRRYKDKKKVAAVAAES